MQLTGVAPQTSRRLHTDHFLPFGSLESDDERCKTKLESPNSKSEPFLPRPIGFEPTQHTGECCNCSLSSGRTGSTARRACTHRIRSTYRVPDVGRAPCIRSNLCFFWLNPSSTHHHPDNFPAGTHPKAPSSAAPSRGSAPSGSRRRVRVVATQLYHPRSRPPRHADRHRKS